MCVDARARAGVEAGRILQSSSSAQNAGVLRLHKFGRDAPKLITLRMTEWGGSECASTHGRFLVAALLGMTRLEGGNDEIDGVEKPTVLGIRNTRRGPSTP
jgi:hypothetical protein